jgi:hypothetical protein
MRAKIDLPLPGGDHMYTRAGTAAPMNFTGTSSTGCGADLLVGQRGNEMLMFGEPKLRG